MARKESTRPERQVFPATLARVPCHNSDVIAHCGAKSEGHVPVLICVPDTLRLCYCRAASQSASARDEKDGTKEAANDGMFVSKRHNYLIFFLSNSLFKFRK